MRVVEIFDSIDGEGIRAGETATFIRLAGCNLRCSYCDTLYALYGEDEECEYTEMSVAEITARVTQKRVTLTGGEPLIHKDAEALIDALLAKGIEVNVETNGAVDVEKFRRDTDKLFFTIDYKLPSSGENDKMKIERFLNLKPYDVIKFVVGSKEDVRKMTEITEILAAHYSAMPHIFAGAVYGMYAPAELVRDILETPALNDVRIQLQMHKIIWDSNMRGV
ncbi:MAG: radical SAM protein [Firmicutes bacterium]|nr:radical SAM protein [Bacillota bacterium]